MSQKPDIRVSASPHCVNCLRWEGKHWYERARCSLLHMHTARLSTCEKFQAVPSLSPDGDGAIRAH